MKSMAVEPRFDPMGAIRKKYRPPLVPGRVSPTAPVSHSTWCWVDATDAAAWEMALAWLPTTRSIPSCFSCAMSPGTAEAASAGSTTSWMCLAPNTWWSLAHWAARATPCSSWVPCRPWEPASGYSAPMRTVELDAPAAADELPPVLQADTTRPAATTAAQTRDLLTAPPGG